MSSQVPTKKIEIELLDEVERDAAVEACCRAELAAWHQCSPQLSINLLTGKWYYRDGAVVYVGMNSNKGSIIGIPNESEEVAEQLMTKLRASLAPQ